jgi:hypothetical protein
MTGGGARDEGSAVVEFCVLAVLMLVPVVYLVLALARIQAGALATEGAAREAGRAFVTADDATSAADRAQRAAAIAFSDQGFGAADARAVTTRCEQVDCLAPDGRVTVHASLQVVLPGVPRGLARIVPARMEVTTTHVATVDRFRASSGGPTR